MSNFTYLNYAEMYIYENNRHVLISPFLIEIMFVIFIMKIILLIVNIVILIYVINVFRNIK